MIALSRDSAISKGCWAGRRLASTKQERQAPTRTLRSHLRQRFAAMDFDALAERRRRRRNSAPACIASYCTTCHGSDARGARGYPNLTDGDWIWGNSEDAASPASIAKGRNAVMPQLAPALGGDEGVINMVNYVRSLAPEWSSGRRGGGYGDAADVCRALQRLSQCRRHWQPVAGRPDLTDDIWLYGGSERRCARDDRQAGRNGIMPPHGELSWARPHEDSRRLYTEPVRR